ncbi:MAG: hypothetical protein KAS93_04670 [Gammaproteobacteria bacterium]|nr:hypothetical protein [Gammaproteobacteria bacterium]
MPPSKQDTEILPANPPDYGSINVANQLHNRMKRHADNVAARSIALKTTIKPESVNQITPLEPTPFTQVTSDMIDKEIRLQKIREKILQREKTIYHLRAIQFFGFHIASILETSLAATKNSLTNTVFKSDNATGKQTFTICSDFIFILLPLLTDIGLAIIPRLVTNQKKTIRVLLDKAISLGAGERDFFIARRIHYKHENSDPADKMESGEAMSVEADLDNLEFIQKAANIVEEIEQRKKNIKDNRRNTFFGSETTQATLSTIALIKVIVANTAFTNGSFGQSIFNNSFDWVLTIFPTVTTFLLGLYNYQKVTTNKHRIGEKITEAKTLPKDTVNQTTLNAVFAKKIIDATTISETPVPLTP